VDDREILLKRQQKVFFQISAAGTSAAGERALAMRPGYDWFFLTTAIALCAWPWASALRTCFCSPWRGHDPASAAARCHHWSSRALNIVSSSSSTTTQLLHAVGCAEAGRYFSRHPEAAAKAEGDYRAFRDVTFHGDEVVFTALGEGSTSQGEFWEALNTASNQKLPVVFCVETTATPSASPSKSTRRAATSPNWWPTSPIFTLLKSTHDPVVCLRAFEEAVAHCAPAWDRLCPRTLRAHVLALGIRRRPQLPLESRARC